MSHRIWVDGVEGAGVPADDPGLLFGLTAFETVRTYGRALFRLGRHLNRLEQSARALDIDCPPRATVAAEIEGVASDDVRIRYTLTGGGRRIVDVAPVDSDRIGRPVRVATLHWQPPPLLPGAVKHGSRAVWLIAARKLDVDEVMLVDTEGCVLEANRSNIWAVIDDVIVTPPIDGRFLEGVTRGALLDAAGEAGLPVREGPIRMGDSISELYLSSTLKELAPVVAWDGREASGAGPHGAELIRAFRELVKRESAEP